MYEQRLPRKCSHWMNGGVRVRVCASACMLDEKREREYKFIERKTRIKIDCTHYVPWYPFLLHFAFQFWAHGIEIFNFILDSVCVSSYVVLSIYLFFSSLICAASECFVVIFPKRDVVEAESTSQIVYENANESGILRQWNEHKHKHI